MEVGLGRRGFVSTGADAPKISVVVQVLGRQEALADLHKEFFGEIGPVHLRAVGHGDSL